MKYNPKARNGTISPVSPPHPPFVGLLFRRVGSDGGRNQSCQILTKSVQGL